MCSKELCCRTVCFRTDQPAEWQLHWLPQCPYFSGRNLFYCIVVLMHVSSWWFAHFHQLSNVSLHTSPAVFTNFTFSVRRFVFLTLFCFCVQLFHLFLDAKHCADSELDPQTRPRSNTLPKSFGSTLDHSSHDAEVKGPRPTREETLDLIQRRVKGKRQEDGWPDDIKVSSKKG